MEIQNEIDKLLTLKESFSKIAGSYDSLVPKEFVTIQLHAENTDLSAYKIKVVNTTSGNEEFYDISASGYTEFEVKYDSVYEIVFPIIGVYITPATRAFTAQKPIRKIEVSYVMAGVFGLDEQGNRYSLEQIEALVDKSIIKYGGYTDYNFENYQKADGTYGCGFMWELYADVQNNIQFALKNMNFNVEEVPNYTSNAFDGQSYTTNIINKGETLGIETPVVDLCASKQVMIGNEVLIGFLPAAQLELLIKNIINFNNLYNACGLVAPEINVGSWWSSCLFQRTFVAVFKNGSISNVTMTSKSPNIFICYPLPK